MIVEIWFQNDIYAWIEYFSFKHDMFDKLLLIKSFE